MKYNLLSNREDPSMLVALVNSFARWASGLAGYINAHVHASRVGNSRGTVKTNGYLASLLVLLNLYTRSGMRIFNRKLLPLIIIHHEDGNLSSKNQHDHKIPRLLAIPRLKIYIS